MLFKGLILLSAAGVKVRERKQVAGSSHARRAAALLRRLMKVPDRAFERALGMSPAALAEYAEAATTIPADLPATVPGQPQSVFNFILGPNFPQREAERIAKKKQPSVRGATKRTTAVCSRTSASVPAAPSQPKPPPAITRSAQPASPPISTMGARSSTHSP